MSTVVTKFGTIDAPLPENQYPRSLIISMEQIHSDGIAVIKKNLGHDISSGKSIMIPDVDGVVTNTSNIALVVRTADCVPILWFDEKNNIVAASHHGWRGTAKVLSMKILNEMKNLGSSIRNIRVEMGPGIGPCCYPIWGERYEMFRSVFPTYGDKIFVQYGDVIGLNIAYTNYLQLLDAGLLKENINYKPSCTSCDNKNFYSYNRDMTEHRMINYIYKK